MDWLKLVAFCWLTAIALWVVRKLLRGDNHTVLFVLLGHWFFCAMPLLLDLTRGMPSYATYGNLALAARDPATNYIYLAYICLIPLVLYPVAVKRVVLSPELGNAALLASTPRGSDRPGSPLPLYALLVLPLFAVAISPQPLLYLTYGFVTDDQVMKQHNMADAHAVVTVTSVFAIIACAALLQFGNSPLRSLLAVLPWAVFAMWVNGKRAIVVFFFGLVVWRLWERKVLRGAVLPLTMAGLALVFAGYTMVYQASVRGIGAEAAGSSEGVYENARIDFGRDHTIKTVIYAELVGDSILGARGKSLVFYAGMYIPRAWWPEKPLPYSVYFTCYALGMPPRLLYWGMTTSIFDELIANTGLIGMLLAPLMLGLLCRFADRTRNTTLRILGFLTCTLFLAAHLMSFMVLFLFWLIGSVIDQQRRFFTLATSRTSVRDGSGR